MKRIMHLLVPVAAASLAVGAMDADAGRVDLDVNAISVDAGGTFDTDFTGTLDVNDTSDTQLVSIFVNGQDMLGDDQPSTINGFIDLMNGTVTGGFLEVSTTGGDMYAADVTENSGNVVQAIENGNYQLGGLTFNGKFTDGDGDGLFAGADLGDIPFDEELPGNFLVLDYDPDSSGQDVADIEFRAVPLPSAALLGAPLVFGLPVLRRTMERLRG